MENMKITMLKGPERVRKRAAIFFDSDDLNGAKNAVMELLYIYLREAQLGFCHCITVEHSGADLLISGDDRGIDLGDNNGEEAKWRMLFCQLYAGPKFPPDESGYSFSLIDNRHPLLYGDKAYPDTVFFPDEEGYAELYALQCVSEEMEVSVNRQGVKSTLAFAKGNVTQELKTAPTTKSDGTTFRFKLDSQVFKETDIPSRFFLEKLEQFAALCPGLTCIYRYDKEPEHVFCYPGGIGDYVGGKAPVYTNTVEGKGRDRYNWAEYSARVQVALGLADRKGSTGCFHNFKNIPYGGTHLEALKKRLCSAFNSCYWKEREVLQTDPLTYKELEKYITVVVATWCTPRCTQWENGTRLSLRNQVITDMTYDAAGEAFSNYLYENKGQYRPVVEEILKNRNKNDM